MIDRLLATTRATRLLWAFFVAEVAFGVVQLVPGGGVGKPTWCTTSPTRPSPVNP
jgi:hypothetical protein